MSVAQMFAAHRSGSLPAVQPAQQRVVVGFAGLARSGKSTAAQYLVDLYDFKRIRFAQALKDMLRAVGLGDREIDGDLKEVPCDLLGGKTPRFAMQTIGTEWGRNLIAPDIWIRVWQGAVGRLPADQAVVCDDVRFPNEVEAIRSLGGIIVRLDRHSAGIAGGHVSELIQFEPDVVLKNDSDDIEVLYAAIDDVMQSRAHIWHI